jgi:predicted DNA-binding protein (UPF0251 family)
MINMSWGRRRRKGRRGRFPKPINIESPPLVNRFVPYPEKDGEAVYLEPAELEALRLVDLEGLSQEAAGEKMGVSRGTVWRLLQSARKKAAKALTESRTVHISNKQSKPRTDNEKNSENMN